MALVTWNPDDRYNVELSENNLVATSNLSDYYYRYARSIKTIKNGKCYCEMKLLNIGSSAGGFGIYDANLTVDVSSNGDIQNIMIYNISGNISNNDTVVNKSEAFTTEDIIGLAINMDDFTLRYYKNGVFQFEDAISLKEIKIIVRMRNNWSTIANFGATEFDIATSNPEEWNRLKSEGYLPYDVENANWFFPKKYLLKSNSTIYTPTNTHLSSTPLDPTQLNSQDFETQGIEDLSLVIGNIEGEFPMENIGEIEEKKILGYKIFGFDDIEKLKINKIKK